MDIEKPDWVDSNPLIGPQVAGWTPNKNSYKTLQIISGGYPQGPGWSATISDRLIGRSEFAHYE
jgi:hypothetical protein